MIRPELAFLISFFIGSIPFGVFIAKLWGIKSLREVGSGNTGATNVVRAAGWKAGALTFILDFLKGLLPMLYLKCTHGCGSENVWIGFAAIIGHCYSPFLKFEGGKGVSTAFGVLFALNYYIGALAGVIYLLTLLTMRISAMGSLFAMLAGLFSIILFGHSDGQKLAFLFIVLIIIYRHKSNWESLLKEN